ncbi:hypothetical protein [Teredinibacter turnerae]|uniref:hypothetical protein n=1 Tax=Teredinibacter turnerae TaxID=2426 RepID=UPI0030CAF481
MHKFLVISIFSASLLLQACGNDDGDADKTRSNPTPIAQTTPSPEPNGSDDHSKVVTDTLLLNTLVKHNEGAFIPAQCYTKTRASNGEVHNPCYACHQPEREPNYLDDGDLQLEYGFRPVTQENKWTNLFKDRSADVAAISDEEITHWVRTSNYFDSKGKIILAEKMADVPANWDFTRDNTWNGFTPDCYYNFDDEGFDRAPSGERTGWRAFAYTPFLGTFWPTNGSTDDVLIRLAPALRQNGEGIADDNIYKLNFAVVEAMIKRANIAIPATEEALYGVDLNRNGTLDVAEEVVYDWKPLEGRRMEYVGKARDLLQAGDLHIAAGLYPEGTEFLHTVRYIDVDDSGEIKLAPRMKELRYTIKASWNNYSQLRNAALSEVKEADTFPERLRSVKGNPEIGLGNGVGWVYQGFIEDKHGDLRPQSYEETVACVGCHSGIGATDDSSFAFPRRVASSYPQAGWSHWSQRGLAGIMEPQWADGTWEYTEYLKQNKSANEFRTNNEVIAKFFDAEGELIPAKITALHGNIGELLLPSPERALELNKAYKVIVDEQSFIYGRDAHIAPLDNVWQNVPEGELTGVESLVVKKY